MINSSFKIQNLDLRCNQIDDECIDILNGILAAENTTLRALNLSDQQVVQLLIQTIESSLLISETMAFG